MEGLLLTRLSDIRYLCGFSGSSGMVLLLSRRGYLLTDFRYREQAALEVTGMELVVVEGGYGEALRNLVKGRGLGKIGFDPAAASYAEVLAWRRKLKGEVALCAVKGRLDATRLRKSENELRRLREGVRIAEEAFRRALRKASSPLKELELAARIDYEARCLGAEGPSFETIVASGGRAAMVHARPAAEAAKGVTVIDWGVSFRGYRTDMTRTVALGGVPGELKRAHRLVLEARLEALEKVRPGVRAGEVDSAAREVIEKGGYGWAFGHGLGHGVGLEVHERPVLGKGSTDVLEEGMVFTVEPGIYIPGIGGVRVEDMVLVKGDGAEVLTGLPLSMDIVDYL